MLRKEPFSESTLELLKTFTEGELLKNFLLAGGPALALQIGHRLSIDLELFTQASSYGNEMLPGLEDRYKFKMHFQVRNTLKGAIRGIKADLITYNSFG